MSWKDCRLGSWLKEKKMARKKKKIDPLDLVDGTIEPKPEKEKVELINPIEWIVEDTLQKVSLTVGVLFTLASIKLEGFVD